jgi:hypothetical protein
MYLIPGWIDTACFTAQAVWTDWEKNEEGHQENIF